MTGEGCGCERCRSVQDSIFNRPGLPALSYRLGTHGSFLRQMLQRLPFSEVEADSGESKRPLADLSTREPRDPSIALLDAWATIADVLTFYQERIANEGFMRTATERGSVLELARTIGYELDPGVAASAFLAFVVEDAPGAPQEAAVPAGVRVQSIPGQDERPQTFETTEVLAARAEWNAMRARSTRPQEIKRGMTQLYLEGIGTQLQPGDAILLVGKERLEYPGSERWDIRFLDSVDEELHNDRTRVGWSIPLGSESPTVDPAENPLVFAFRQRAALFGYNAPDFRAMPLGIKQAFDPDYPDDLDRRRTRWPDFTIIRDGEPVIDLDAAYPKILAGSWIALVKPSYIELYKVVEAEAASRTDFTLTSKTTRLRLDTTEHLLYFGLRHTLVLGQSEELRLAEEPIAEALTGSEIVLPGDITPLDKGRPVIVGGRLHGSDADAEVNSEATFVKAMSPLGTDTLLEVDPPLQQSYEIASVSIAANVARSTHGEFVTEIVGGGRGELANQSFALKKPPLTYIPAATAGGTSNTLVVRVDGVQWQEQPTLFGLSSHSESFVVRLDDNGLASVTFGDGTNGARLPTGAENVRATYRSGIGVDGNVGEGSLSLLLTRPLGIRNVINPLASEGGTAPEGRDDARRNAPSTILTMDRIVSLLDYEDFARAFTGIGKASAAALFNGERRFVHLTVAGDRGAPISVTSDLFLKLQKAIDGARDPSGEVLIDIHEARSFALTARVLVDPRFVVEEVLARVEGALADSFSFEPRSFGQPVTAAEVTTVVQGIEGVTASSLELLYPTDVVAEAGTFQEFLASRLARMEGAEVAPAQLLLIAPGLIVLEEMKS